jgi:hypothetical protein
MVGINEHNYADQPITSSGVIGDCHSAVLISLGESIAWRCLPDFASLSAFAYRYLYSPSFAGEKCFIS